MRISSALAFAIPLAAGIFSSSLETYWLDSPELTAAAQTLGIVHPPGHPLFVIFFKPFTLFPVGTISFRVSLASSVAGAFATFVLMKIIFTILSFQLPSLPSSIRRIISLGSSLTAFTTYSWWFQCVRAEVYSMQILIVLTAFYFFIKAVFSAGKYNAGGSLTQEKPEGKLSDSYFYLSAFITGVGLTNHHFIMIQAMPAAIPFLFYRYKYSNSQTSFKVFLGKSFTSISGGLLPYLFLPLRSFGNPVMSLGSTASFSDFLWVVTAKAYLKSMTAAHESQLFERSGDVLFSMMGQFGPVFIVVSVAGIYFLLRKKISQIAGLSVLLLTAVTIIMRSAIGSDVFNPDFHGYMLGAIAGISIGAGVFSAVVISFIYSRKKYRSAAFILCFGMLVFPVIKGNASYKKVNLSDFTATRLFFDYSVKEAPAGSTYFTTNYKLFFLLWSSKYIDGARSDIKVINPYFFSYPGYLKSVLLRHPEHKKTVWSMLVHGKLTENTISDSALKNPLFIEPDLMADESILRHLLPGYFVYEAFPEPVSKADVAAFSIEYIKSWKKFYLLLGNSPMEIETRKMLVFTHFLDALFFARRSENKGAKRSLEMAYALGSRSRQLKMIEEILKKDKPADKDFKKILDTF